MGASVRTPEGAPSPGLSPEDADRRLRHAALLRCLTDEEEVALLRDRQQPERLGEIADAVGLSVEECRSVLAGIVWTLTEGLHPRAPDAGP